MFSLRVEKYAQGSDRVIVDITPLASGCDVTVTHEMSPAYAEHIKRTEEGWAAVLVSLDKTLGSRA